MRLAQIENGIVINVIEADERPDWAADWPEAGEAAPGWVVEDNNLVPPQAPAPPVPAVVSRFQARAALFQAGLLPSVEAAVAGADLLTQMAWADAVEFRRDSAAIKAIAVALGLDAQAVDTLFRAAADISA